jgi:hypothetical protein
MYTRLHDAHIEMRQPRIDMKALRFCPVHRARMPRDKISRHLFPALFWKAPSVKQGKEGREVGKLVMLY